VERIAETAKVVFHARDALPQPVILVNVKLRLFSLAMESEQKFAVAHIGKGVILKAQKTRTSSTQTITLNIFLYT
jgi:hypothetical protein